MKIIKNIQSLRFNHYETIAWTENKRIYGIDEVGRGCLAGPLVTAAVSLSPHAFHPLLKDSKTLSRKELLEAYQWLLSNSIWAVAIMHHRLIDQLNIYRATQIGMKRALIQLLSIDSECPHTIVIDAMPLTMKSINIPICHFNYGESLSISIAAASIIAKITRDALIHRFDMLVPGYQFSEHKGYGTVDHLHCITHAGLSLIHRKTFTSSALQEKPEVQINLFTQLVNPNP